MPWCCLVPATAFFEWQAIEGQKNKHKIRIARADGDMVTLAGDAIASYTVLTTAPNTLMEAIRNRMPVILGQSEED
jgi:putative SOS response-associated peptidase YedK